MPLIAERSQVAIKMEAVAGTAETLAAANVILTSEMPTYSLESEVVERQALSAALSQRGVVIGSRQAKISFKMFLRGTTGAPVDPTNLPDFDLPFQGCGLKGATTGGVGSEITTYKPDSALAAGLSGSEKPYMTIGSYIDGKLWRIAGAVGNLKLTWTKGRPTLAEFEFSGVYVAPSDVALLSPTYPAVVEPPFLSAALSVLGFATPKIDTLVLDLANRVAMRPSPNTATGFLTAQITGRRAAGTLDPEDELVATKDWFGEFTGGTTGSLTTGDYPSTGTQYNKFNFTAPKAQYSGLGREERDGVLVNPVAFVAQANSNAGDDEFTLVQK